MPPTDRHFKRRVSEIVWLGELSVSACSAIQMILKKNGRHMSLDMNAGPGASSASHFEGVGVVEVLPFLWRFLCCDPEIGGALGPQEFPDFLFYHSSRQLISDI